VVSRLLLRQSGNKVYPWPIEVWELCELCAISVDGCDFQGMEDGRHSVGGRMTLHYAELYPRLSVRFCAVENIGGIV
jgi:hypothetical protein